MFLGLEGTVIIFFALIVLWLLSLSFFLLRTIRHYNLLTRGVSEKFLSSVLEEVLENLKTEGGKIKELEKRLTAQEKEAKFYLQKIGLLRFNPFAETGGEQSFIISLLDKNNNGIVLTSLQGRMGTRWYSKVVRKGKGVKFKLSKEEEETVKKAKALNY